MFHQLQPLSFDEIFDLCVMEIQPMSDRIPM